jgi:hypothetical protein
MTLTVKHLLAIADKAQKAIAQGELKPTDEVYLSLEVTDDNDEDTSEHRVHGGELIQADVIKTPDGEYVHIQMIGVPNFNILSRGRMNDD